MHYFHHPSLCLNKLAVLSSDISGAAANCPSDWVYNADRERCYKYITNDKSYAEAFDNCILLDAILATPKNASERDFIYDQVIKYVTRQNLM